MNAYCVLVLYRRGAPISASVGTLRNCDQGATRIGPTSSPVLASCQPDWRTEKDETAVQPAGVVMPNNSVIHCTKCSASGGSTYSGQLVEVSFCWSLGLMEEK